MLAWACEVLRRHPQRRRDTGEEGRQFNAAPGTMPGEGTAVAAMLPAIAVARLRLDVASTVDDPKETPVVVVNKKEFDQAMKRLG